MPTQVFTSPEAHVAAVANTNSRISLLLQKARGPYRISSLVLPDFRAQWGEGGGGTLTEGAVVPGCAWIFVPTQNGQTMRMNGRQLDAQTLRLQLTADELSLSSMEPHCWFSIAMTTEVFAEWSGAGTMAKAPSSRFLRIPRERAEVLQRAVAQLGSIVQWAPDAFESSVALKTTARKLTELVREAIGGSPTQTTPPGRPSLPRKQIIRAVMDSIDQHDGEYQTVTDLASAACVSERTLRAAFQDCFGIGPTRFLRVRKLNMIRDALRNSDPALATVTAVATRFGDWDLSRFARDYQLLFGELPHETLRHVR
jgi:AraC family ethanolamine operon transcriptional activator